MRGRLTASLAIRCLIIARLLGASLAGAAETLTVCTEADPDGFDIVQYNSLVSTNAAADVIFNGLVAFDEVANRIVPALSDRWEVSEDGLNYTFHLRPQVQFQATDYFRPKRALNADDVIFTFDRMLNADNPWHSISGPGGFPHAQAMQLPQRIASIKKLDAYRVRFTLYEPDATFLPMLTMGFASIYSAEYAHQLLQKNRAHALNLKPVGTGPFILRAYRKDAIIRYRANPHYWGAPPKVKQLIYDITPDAAVRAQKLKAGECQIVLSPRPQDVLSAKRGRWAQAVEAPAFMTAFVAFNTQHKPFNNKKVRQAINLAFDRAAYLKTVFNGAAVAAINPYPPSTWSYAGDIPSWPHDPARAKQLLAKAGYPAGFKTTIWTRSTGSLLNPNPKIGAELLQADLAKVGIRAQVKMLDWGQLIHEAKQGRHDLLFMGWAGDNGDPDNFLTPQFSCAAVRSGTNFARYCNQALDKLITEARASADRATRARLYAASQKMIHQAALWLPVAHPAAAVLMRDGISGYRISPFGRQNFSTVSVN